MKKLFETSLGWMRQLRASQFSRDAAWMLFFNLVTRLIAMVGSGYAARCLGPAKLGVSGVVLSLCQQMALASNGGFDPVVTREIARDPSRALEITRTVFSGRLALGLLLALLWIIASFCLGPLIPLHVKLLGVPIFLMLSLNLFPIFQGLEKLPIQTGIGTLVSLISAASIFAFFHPGMPVGADLAVNAFSNFLGWVLAIWFFVHLVGQSPLGRIDMAALGRLLGQSWRYWANGLVAYLYTSFQVPVVAYFLGWEQAGLFRSALILSLGVETLYSSLNNLLLARFVRWQREGPEVFRQKQGRLAAISLGIGIAVSVAGAAAAPLLYHLLFGPQYAPSIGVFRILLAGRSLVFVGQVYAYGLVAQNRDREVFTASMAGALVSLGLSALLVRPFGILGASWISLVSESVVVGICVFHAFCNDRRGMPVR